MSISLSIQNKQHFNISDDRLNKVLTQGYDKATHLGLWDKIKDFFRTDKKQAVLNELYTLVHADDKKAFSKVEAMLNAFEKIKAMVETTADQEGFKIEQNHNSITFIMGSATYCYKEQESIDEYRLMLSNADTNFKERVLENIDKHIQSSRTTSNQLELDVGRMGFDFDGARLRCDDQLDIDIKIKYLGDFLKKLTPEQQKALNVVGSQLAIGRLRDAAIDIAGGVAPVKVTDTGVKYQIKNNGDLEVCCSLRQDISYDIFDQYRQGLSLENTYYYPQLALTAIFTIKKDAEITCNEFRFFSLSKALDSQLPATLVWV